MTIDQLPDIPSIQNGMYVPLNRNGADYKVPLGLSVKTSNLGASGSVTVALSNYTSFMVVAVSNSSARKSLAIGYASGSGVVSVTQAITTNGITYTPSANSLEIAANGAAYITIVVFYGTATIT